MATNQTTVTLFPRLIHGLSVVLYAGASDAAPMGQIELN